MTDPASAAPTYQQIVASWNAQADEHNQWGDLGDDEKIEWAVACAKAAPPAVVEPLTNEQVAVACGWAADRGCKPLPQELRIARAIEAAHGIGIKKGDSNGLPT